MTITPDISVAIAFVIFVVLITFVAVFWRCFITLLVFIVVF